MAEAELGIVTCGISKKVKVFASLLCFYNNMQSTTLVNINTCQMPEIWGSKIKLKLV